MDKQDVLVVLMAIACFSVMALVVKPILTGHPAAAPPGTVMTPAQIPPSPSPIPATTTAVEKSPETVTTPVPTPTWDKSVKRVNFLNSSGDQAQPPPNPTIPPYVVPNRSMITYAVISGRWSGTTENLYISSPYWIMEYTADPVALPPDVFPRLVIQVFDVRDPNREVRVINMPIYERQHDEPWVEKFFEGRREYYFMVSTRYLKSFTITIKIPLQYA